MAVSVGIPPSPDSPRPIRLEDEPQILAKFALGIGRAHRHAEPGTGTDCPDIRSLDSSRAGSRLGREAVPGGIGARLRQCAAWCPALSSLQDVQQMGGADRTYPDSRLVRLRDGSGKRKGCAPK